MSQWSFTVYLIIFSRFALIIYAMCGIKKAWKYESLFIWSLIVFLIEIKKNII